jgi:glycosyltransferase involved in cell wall biosynthesis
MTEQAVKRCVLLVPLFHPNLQGLVASLDRLGYEVHPLVISRERQEGDDLSPPTTRVVRTGIGLRVVDWFRAARGRDSVRYWKRPPSLVALFNHANELRPALLIVRSTPVGVAKAYLVSRCLGCTFLLYNVRGMAWPQLPTIAEALGATLLRAINGGRLRRITPISEECEMRRTSPFVDSWWVPFSSPLFDAEPASPRVERAAVRLLFVGGLMRFKRIELLLKVVRSLADRGREVTLTVVGSGLSSPGRERSSHAAAYLHELEALAVELGIGQRITWCHDRSYDEVWKLYEIHDLFISLAREQGGMAVPEAMSCGLPAVVSDEIGAASYLRARGGEVTGGCIVRGSDWNSAADAIESWLEPPNSLAALGKEARALVRNYFTTDRTCQALAAAIGAGEVWPPSRGCAAE